MERCKTIKPKSRREWLVERLRGIGASEVSTILGLNPWDSPYALWCRKTQQIPPAEENLPMRLGHLMEPVLTSLYEEKTGATLSDPGEYTIYVHPEHIWLRATLDRLARNDHTFMPVELKTANLNMAKEWTETSAPLGYQTQLQIQMACTGTTEGEIAALVGNDKFYIIRYERNDEFLEGAIPVLREFWECCQTMTPPEIDGHDATTKAIKMLHPLDNGKTTILPEDVRGFIAEWEEAKASVKEETTRANAAQNKIIAALAQNTFGKAGDQTMSFKAQTRGCQVSVSPDYIEMLEENSIPYDKTDAKTFRVLRKVKQRNG